MAALSVKVTSAQSEEMIKELDVNARGAIQLPQFIILMERHTQVRVLVSILALFISRLFQVPTCLAFCMSAS